MKKKWIVLILILIILAAGAIYFADYYHAKDLDINELNKTVNISKIDNGYFIDGPGNDTALIFYPGAKVESTAYLPLLCQLSKNGVDCFLIDMPLNFAFFNMNAADYELNNYNYSHWYLGGHSFGGLTATMYAKDHESSFDGLILLAAYTTNDLNVPTLLVYGDKDIGLDMDDYNQGLSYLHGGFTEVVIHGGNHARFASYGDVDGDGIATISREQQVNQTVEAILDFVGLH